VRWRAAFLVREDQRLHPRRSYWRCIGVEDAADNFAIGEYVEIVIIPFAGWAPTHASCLAVPSPENRPFRDGHHIGSQKSRVAIELSLCSIPYTHEGAAMMMTNASLPFRGRRIRFTPQVIEKIKELVAEGVSRDEIANRVGVSVGSLRVTCSKLVLACDQLLDATARITSG